MRKKQVLIKIFFIALFLLTQTACSSHNDMDFDKKSAAKARVELALAFLMQKDFTQAKRNLDKAFFYTPDSALVSTSYAYFYQLQGNKELAEKYYQKAINQNKEQGDIRNNYAVFLCEIGQFEKAYKQFNFALASPNYYRQVDTYENIAICAYMAKNEALFHQYYEKLMQISPKNAQQLMKKIQQLSH